jgi:hypothetical protein
MLAAFKLLMIDVDDFIFMQSPGALWHNARQMFICIIMSLAIDMS